MVVGSGGGRRGGEAVEWVGASWRMVVVEEQEGIEGCLAPYHVSVFAEAHLGRCMQERHI